MIVALAAPRVAASIDEGLERVRECIAAAGRAGAEIVCFPEAYVPGLRGLDFDVPPFDNREQDRVLAAVTGWAATYRVATILGMERLAPAGRQIACLVIDAGGKMLGWQTKNQLDPSEEAFYVPGDTRQVFEVNGVTFGVVICHEGFRYPETVRWAARRGARLVFHPHCTGSDQTGPRLTQWCGADNPYYEKAMMCRALENGIYVAGTNYGFRYPESATCVIAPSGTCIAQMRYGEAGVLVQHIDMNEATGLLASRYAPERYQERQAE